MNKTQLSTNEIRIQKLLEIWYSCLVDHHKDRDCHFEIIRTYTAYDKLDERRWGVNHSGYLFSDEDFLEFKTFKHAQSYLIDLLKKMIKETAMDWMNNDFRADEFPKDFWIEKINSSQAV